MLKAFEKKIVRPDKLTGLKQLTEKEKEPISILMNQKRQKILQFIFKFPCKHLHGIARNFGYSINTTRWHIRKLKQFGYIDEYKSRNRKIYFPSNCLREIDIRILGLLNDNKIEPLFIEIIHSPGITQKELCKSLKQKQTTIFDRLSLLENNELIYSQKDGLYSRYYPTSMINSREKNIRKALKKYRRFLIQLLERDGVEPEILRTTDRNFHLRIKSGKGWSDLIFNFNPYERFLD